jgi:hypothetical protein
MDVCLFRVLCVVRSRSLRRIDHSSRGVLTIVALRCVWSRNLENEEAKARYRAVENTNIMGCNARKTSNKQQNAVFVSCNFHCCLSSHLTLIFSSVHSFRIPSIPLFFHQNKRTRSTVVASDKTVLPVILLFMPLEKKQEEKIFWTEWWRRNIYFYNVLLRNVIHNFRHWITKHRARNSAFMLINCRLTCLLLQSWPPSFLSAMTLCTDTCF